tara:strand:+ start:2958 stop:6299 length:3342 start_codon:yes stop_codon:yes gene_type:complete
MKKLINIGCSFIFALKWDLKMKLTAFFLLVCMLQINATTYSQKTRISLDMNDVQLSEVLNRIETISEFKFFVDTQKIDVKFEVNIKADKERIFDILDKLFHGTDITYEVYKKQILLKKVDVKPTKSMSIDSDQGNIETKILQQVISGGISDNVGTPLPGANILEKGTTNGTQADFDGNFTISVEDLNAVLVISYVGFATKEVSLNGQTNLNITLEESAAGLDEVVVVGYGTQKRLNLTGSVSTVDGEELAKQVVGQTSSAIQGAMPGVTVRRTSGKPGSDGGEIRIRGIGTLGNSSPLTLIDGVPSDLNNVDPNDIESISVLKDAASAAIYGSRAANGVVLITTKRAKEGELSFAYSTSTGFNQPTNLPKKVNALDHMLLINEANTNIGNSPVYSEEFINEHIANSPSDLYPDTNWQDEVLKSSGITQNHYASVNSGSEKLRLMGSLGYFDQQGIVENNSYKRIFLRVNNDLKVSESISIGLDVLARTSKSIEPSQTAETVVHWMNRIPATQGGVNSDGTYGLGWNGDNPIGKARDGGKRTTNLDEAIISLKLLYKPTDWLNFDLLYAPSYSLNHFNNFSRTVDSYYDQTLVYTTPTISSLDEFYRKGLNQTVRALITFTKLYGRNDIKVLAGYEQNDFKTRFIRGYRENFPIQEFQVLDAGAVGNQTATGSGTDNALQSIFGRINYAYDDRYLLEGNLRYDGSSRFSEGNKFGLFPSVSAGWVFSRESFLDNVEVLNYGKLRASYGQLGNQNIGGDFPFLSTINLGQNYSFGNKPSDGAALTDLANPLISWETSEMTNFGIELGFFNKLNLAFEYYVRNTNEILLSLPIPSTVGLNPPFQNAGKVENKGWDFSISYKDYTREFKYNLQFNISDVKNQIIDLKDAGPFIVENQIRQVGEPIDALFGYDAIGYFQSQEEVDNSAQQFGTVAPGDIKYRDVNDDGEINAEDRVVFGNIIPRYTFGLNLTFEYKQFDFNTLFQGVGQADGYIEGHGVYPFYVGGTAQEMHKDRWSPENPESAFPRLAFDQSNNVQTSDFWVRDASYLRCKNMQVGYSLPSNALEKISLKQLRFYVGVQNLFTLDNFHDGFDVEAPVGDGRFYPILRTYSLGMNVNF